MILNEGLLFSDFPVSNELSNLRKQYKGRRLIDHLRTNDYMINIIPHPGKHALISICLRGQL